MIVSRLNVVVLAAAGLSLTFAGVAYAGKIHTGGARGAYYNDFCPPLANELNKAKFNYKCTLSLGSNENIERVKENPEDIGFSQFDVFALSAVRQYPAQPFHVIRNDIARECLFMVTRNKDLSNFGDVAARAGELNFILPPQGSGSASTFDYLRQIDPDGLGRAVDVTYTQSTDIALKKALGSDEKAVALFVQFPDPNNDRFKLIAKEKGLFIPVIDRNILRQQIDGQKIYFAQETDVSNGKFWKKGAKVTTACTPMVIFTGNPQLMNSGDQQLDQKDMINTVNDIPSSKLLPKQGFFKKYWSKTRSLSASAVEKMMDASEKAREKTAPMLETAKQKAKELGARAAQKTRELGEKAAPMLKTAKEKAKELGEKAMDKARDLGEAAKEKMHQ
jgi:hypothetical protein